MVQQRFVNSAGAVAVRESEYPMAFGKATGFVGIRGRFRNPSP
jgi:hypothetical protein